MKRHTTAWKLLIWAYRIQMVQYDTDWCGEGSRDDGLGPPEMFDVALAPTAERSMVAHADAHIVHRHVVKLRWPAPRLIIDSAARRQPPVWNPNLPLPRIVPSRRSTGSIRMIYGVTRKGRKSHEQIGCWIEYEGISDAEAAEIRSQARATYTTWWEGLRLLAMQIDGLLDRWTIIGLGASREPWKNVIDKNGKIENAEATVCYGSNSP